MIGLEVEVGEHSASRAPAHLWTTVAEDGLESELMSDSFTWDDSYFFRLIDCKAFADCMKRGD